MPNPDLHPRERLLNTAGELFYRYGIHSVGVDWLVTEAGVTRATFYRHFDGKEALVEAYLRATDRLLRTRVETAMAAGRPEDALETLLKLMHQRTTARGFRGCQFINAAAEYPDPAHRVRLAVADHRDWFRRAATDIARAVGHPKPAKAAEYLVLLHDAALIGAELDDPATTEAAVQSAARQLLGTA